MKKKSLVYISLGSIIFILFILYMTGFLTSKVSPDKLKFENKIGEIKEKILTKTEEIQVYYESTGTVASKKEILISSQIRGLISNIFYNEGDKIESGKILVKIDDEEVKNKIEDARKGVEIAEFAQQQAIQTLITAQANYGQTKYQYDIAQSSLDKSKEQLNATNAAFNEAKLQYERIKKFKEKKAATEKDLERAESAFSQSKATLEQAKLSVESSNLMLSNVEEMLKSAKATIKQAELGIDIAKARLSQAQKYLNQANINFKYTEIKSPVDGVIVKKHVESGDLALPGKPLLVIYNPKELRLEAEISESMIKFVGINKEFTVNIDSEDYVEKGKVTEIIPSADPVTRTFLVKVSIPHKGNIHPGMFGKLFIPFKKDKVLLLPSYSIIRIGQLESVYIETKEGLHLRRLITTGKNHGTKKEIFSGLEAGETVLVVGESKNGRK